MWLELVEGGVVWPAFLQFRCGTIVAYQSVSTYRRAGSERLERHGLSINELLSVQRLYAQPNLTQSFPTGKKKFWCCEEQTELWEAVVSEGVQTERLCRRM